MLHGMRIFDMLGLPFDLPAQALKFPPIRLSGWAPRASSRTKRLLAREGRRWKKIRARQGR